MSDYSVTVMRYEQCYQHYISALIAAKTNFENVSSLNTLSTNPPQLFSELTQPSSSYISLIFSLLVIHRRECWPGSSSLSFLLSKDFQLCV